MNKFFRLVFFLACAGWLLSPLSGTFRPVAAAPGLTVSPASAAQGSWVQVTGSGFSLVGADARLYWNTTVFDSIPLARAAVGPDGAVVFDVRIPPDTPPGTAFFFVWVTGGRVTEDAQVNVNVTASQRKAALITPANQALGASFKALLDSHGLATTLFDYNTITSSTNFNIFDLVLISPDSSAGTGWGTPAARTALALCGRPILGLGDGGYYYFGTRQLQIGWGNGAHGSTTQVMPLVPHADIFNSPYVITDTTFFNSSSPTVEIFLPQPGSATFQFGQVPQGGAYYNLVQQGRYFLWGLDGSPESMTLAGQQTLVNVAWHLADLLSYNTLVLSNLNRMTALGFPAADVNDLGNHLSTLVGKPASQTNMTAVRMDLGIDGTAAIASAYSAWDAARGSVPLTNNLAYSVDAFLENWKHAVYPNLKYFILAGSQEIIPMQARAADNHDETSWGDPPAGYLADLYHSTYNSAKGYYLTDTLYSDLSYVIDGWGADSMLVPEMSVGRLVETPSQISGLIDTYLASNASLSRYNKVSIASKDYLDGATFAANAMGSSADTSLIQSGQLSSLVPTKLNTKHGVVYIGGHGNYNWMTMRWWDQGFMAGATGSQGDTEDLSNLDNAAIAAAGCHNGVLFPNLTYHDYDGTTTYGEFPERLAAHHVGVYAGATGYTWITLSGDSTNAAYSDYSEKLAGLFIQHLLNDGGTTAGKAFQSAVKQYENDRGVGHLDGGDRRAVSILTFYGIPNYRFSTFAQVSKIFYGYSLKLVNLVLGSPAAAPVSSAVETSATLTLDVNNYSVGADGLVTIPGASYAGDSNHPILPVLGTHLSFPGSASIVSASLDMQKSTFITIPNNIPAVTAGTSDGKTVFLQPPVMNFSGFYPDDNSLVYSTTTTPLGGSGTELNLGVIPVQYNHDTGETRIWTHLAFNIVYTSDTSDASLDSDGDGLPDWWENATGLDPLSAVGDNGAPGDPDQDGLVNAQEFTRGTDPLNPDSDYDGYLDGMEVLYGSDPLDPGSHPWEIYLPILFR